MCGESLVLKMKLNEYLFCNLYCLVLIRDEKFEETSKKIQHPVPSDSMIVGEYLQSVNALIQTVCMNRKNTSVD